MSVSYRCVLDGNAPVTYSGTKIEPGQGFFISIDHSKTGSLNGTITATIEADLGVKSVAWEAWAEQF